MGFLRDATDFTDMEKKSVPQDGYPGDLVCPKCYGYGGWNLKLNAYPLRDRPDTPENRHLFTHFRASCAQCNGWGWVGPEDATCIHDYHELSQQECRERKIEHWGMCWHVYQCTKCGRTMSRDSSG